MKNQNHQNNFIKKQLNKAQRAVEILVKQGVTILGVEMARQKPRIEIQRPAANDLGKTLLIRGTQQGLREELKFSQCNGCIVYWKS